MEKNHIVEILMRRDRMTEDEAINTLIEARQQVLDGEDPKNVLREQLQLEFDYMEDLI